MISFGKIGANLGKEATSSPSASSADQGLGSFGTFGKKAKEKNATAIQELDTEADQEEDELQKVMGMTAFGKKAARTFDVQEMMDNIKKTVIEVSGDKPGIGSESNQDQDVRFLVVTEFFSFVIISFRHLDKTSKKGNR